jgi:hypothetical protein
VKPVTSGYRIVLVYNLIHRPSASLLQIRDDKAQRLTDLLETWERGEKEPESHLHSWDYYVDDNRPPALLYALEHQYTMVELNFARLKGADQSRFGELHNACQKTGFDIYLANIEKTNAGSVDDGGYYGRKRYHSPDIHHITDLFKTSLKLKHIVSKQGVVVGGNVPFPENMLIQGDIFDRDPDREDFQGFTGNEGASATHFYQETVSFRVNQY